MNRPDQITAENCRLLLAAFMDENEIGASSVAKAIGCSHSTLARILSGTTQPTEDFLKQVGILIELGFDQYKKLSDSQKEKIAEKIGVVGGTCIGFGTITAAISASGVVAGLSAAGITSGLAAIGHLVGGGMAVGVGVLAAIPIAGGVLGYGIIKGVKSLILQAKLDSESLDEKWEISLRT